MFSRTAVKLLRTTIICCLFAAIVMPCSAVSMKVTGGFDKIAKAAAWTPIVVELDNPDNREINGVLEVRQGDKSLPTCSPEVILPGNSRKLYHVYARFREWGTVRVALRSGGRVLAVQQASIDFAAQADLTVISVGARSSQLSFLNREQLSTGGQGSSIFVGAVPASHLPDRPAGYEGLDVLVVSSLSPNTTDPRVLQAIGTWVASGGTLVVSTGPDYRSFRNEFFDEMLPVKITGAADLRSLPHVGGVNLPATGVSVAKSTARPGIAVNVVSQDGVPVYAERRYGAGRVVFLAFDHLSGPFRNWDGQAAFWKSVLSSGRGKPLVVATGFTSPWPEQFDRFAMPGDQGLDTVVQQNPSVGTPSSSTIFLFLLGYIVVLVPVNYLTLSRMRRRELAWVTTPAIIALFTLGAYGIGYHMKGGSLRLREATFVEASADCRYARVITEASAFSPASRTYNVALGDGLALWQALPAMDEPDFPSVTIGARDVMKKVRMAMWSSKPLESTSGTDLGGHVQADLVLDGSRLHGTIRNNTGLDLKDCELVWGGRHKKLGRLARGESLKVNLDRNVEVQPAPPVGSGPVVSPQAPAGPPPPMSPPRTEPSSDDLKAASQTVVNDILSRSGEAKLLAKVEKKPLFSMPGQHARVESVTYYAFILDCRVGSEFSLDASAIPGRITASENSVSEDYYGSTPPPGAGIPVNLHTSGWVIAAYKLPVSGDSQVTDLVVESRIDETKAEVSAFNFRSGKWVRVEGGESIPDPGDYLSSLNEVRVKVAAPGSNGVNGRVGISIKGRRR